MDMLASLQAELEEAGRGTLSRNTADMDREDEEDDVEGAGVGIGDADEDEYDDSYCSEGYEA